MEEFEDNYQDSNNKDEPQEAGLELQKTVHIQGMYKNWFLDYASYVILERAVPEIKDGLKPVQRRIIHAMKELDDGRYNKVANIIGNTMQYHPHGDASIGDALVQLGQKDLLIDTQGNWGNVLTGDSAAASRYIEARLSKFALEVVFNPKVTEWKKSYDGRKNEPLALPVKFPLLLALGSEGIAVGLASKILPHNFHELLDACVEILKGYEPVIYPDFNTGGLADFTKYNDGKRGGRVRVRAKIIPVDKKTIKIIEVPFGTTTTSLIDSIVSANDKGKIKIRKIDDNTSEQVEIIIHLAPGISADTTIDALYAFTTCEVSLSPNCCVINDNRPAFLGTTDILHLSVKRTKENIRKELELQLSELKEQWHFLNLERIFIEERIYRRIEKAETWEAVLQAIENGLKPFLGKFHRDVTREDIVKLTEIKIKRISRYNSDRANEVIIAVEDDIKQLNHHLENLIDYVINYYKNIKKKYGKGRERKTEIRNFDTIEASMVAVANSKLYLDKNEGFAGTALKKADYVCDCSDIDDIIFFRSDGTFMVTKVSEKLFVGKNVIHINVFKRNDERTIFNLVYRDGMKGHAMVKRFAVLGVTRDKEYEATKGNKNSRVLYFTANPNGEAEVIKVLLKPKPRLKNLSFEFDFSELNIKNRSAQGNILTRHAVERISKKEEGISTLGAMNIWFDEVTQRLNMDEKGKYLGAFKGHEKILALMKSGYYRLHDYELTTHFDDDMLQLMKFNDNICISVVYKDKKSGYAYLKRFHPEMCSDLNRKIDFINAEKGNVLLGLTLNPNPQLRFDILNKKNEKVQEIIEVDDFIAIKGYKAKGKRLSTYTLKRIEWIEKKEEETNPEGMKKKEHNDTLSKDNPKKDTNTQGPRDKYIETESKEQDRKGAGNDEDNEKNQLSIDF